MIKSRIDLSMTVRKQLDKAVSCSGKDRTGTNGRLRDRLVSNACGYDQQE